MIRKSARMALALPLLLAATACGKLGDLEPHAGQSKVPTAYGATRAQTAEELFTPSVQARPGRSDELMRRSERRDVDPFDVPPGATAVPLPGQVEAKKEEAKKPVDTKTDPEQR